MKKFCILFGCLVSLSTFAAPVPGQMTSWGLVAINAVDPGTKFKAISAGNGSSHCLALTTQGTVVDWGENDEGPVSIPTGLSNVGAIAGGASSSLALKSDGTVVGWGDNSYGQTNVPAGLTNVLAVAAGDDHCVALKTDGSVQAWGLNYAGEATVPPGLQSASQIGAGGEISMAVIPSLQIYSLTIDGHDAALRFHTFSGRQYGLQFTPALNPANWQDVPGGPVLGTGYDPIVTDTKATLNAPARFYRLQNIDR